MNHHVSERQTFLPPPPDCGFESAEINQFLNTPLQDVAILYMSVFAHWVHESFVSDKCTYRVLKLLPQSDKLNSFGRRKDIASCMCVAAQSSVIWKRSVSHVFYVALNGRMIVNDENGRLYREVVICYLKLLRQKRSLKC